jgi:PPOX class probable F420-dependent enzyme
VSSFSAQHLAFLEKNHGAAMITLRADGMPHSVRVGVALVDGKLWSSGTQRRARTKHLRRDPRSTLWVFDTQFFWLTIESAVTLLEGPEAVEHNVQLFRIMQNRPSGPMRWFGKELDEQAFRQQMIDEQRLIYEFEPQRLYGMLEMPTGPV